MLDWLEIFGVASCLLYIYLEIKQRAALWIVGFISSAVYVVVFYREGFYASSTLYVYYMAASIYGIYCWRFSQKKDNAASAERPISRLKLLLCVILAFISAILFVIIWYTLDNVPYSTAVPPYCEALATALSIVATWMLARKILEQWILWIFVNFFWSFLYFWGGLYPTGGLFVVYGIMSVVGWMEWKRSFNNSKIK